MKKNKISIGNLKVQSFVTQVPQPKALVGGGESLFNTVCPMCDGGSLQGPLETPIQ